MNRKTNSTTKASPGKFSWGLIVRLRKSAVLGLTAAMPLALLACGDTGSGPESTPVSSQSARTQAAIIAPSGTARGSVSAPPVVAATPSEIGDPISRKVSYGEAEIAYQTKEYRQASRLFEAYTLQRPDNPWGHYMLGLSAWKSGDLETAETAFDGAIFRDPTHVKSFVNLTRVLVEAGKSDKALETIQKAIELDPESGQAHRVHGNVLSDLGDVENAIVAYRTAIRLDPQDAWSMNNLGLVMIRQGRDEEALLPLARANELKPNVAVFLNNLGVALERSGYPSAAADAFAEAIDADSSYTKAEISLARVGELTESDTDHVDLPALAHAFVLEIEGQIASGGEPPASEPEPEVGG